MWLISIQATRKSAGSWMDRRKQLGLRPSTWSMMETGPPSSWWRWKWPVSRETSTPATWSTPVWTGLSPWSELLLYDPLDSKLWGPLTTPRGHTTPCFSSSTPCGLGWEQRRAGNSSVRLSLPWEILKTLSLLEKPQKVTTFVTGPQTWEPASPLGLPSAPEAGTWWADIGSCGSLHSKIQNFGVIATFLKLIFIGV